MAALGIGTGERESNAPYGVDWSRPVARFEEAVVTIRALWDSNGELVTPGSCWLLMTGAVRSGWQPSKSVLRPLIGWC